MASKMSDGNNDNDRPTETEQKLLAEDLKTENEKFYQGLLDKRLELQVGMIRTRRQFAKKLDQCKDAEERSKVENDKEKAEMRNFSETTKNQVAISAYEAKLSLPPSDVPTIRYSDSDSDIDAKSKRKHPIPEDKKVKRIVGSDDDTDTDVSTSSSPVSSDSDETTQPSGSGLCKTCGKQFADEDAYHAHTDEHYYDFLQPDPSKPDGNLITCVACELQRSGPGIRCEGCWENSGCPRCGDCLGCNETDLADAKLEELEKKQTRQKAHQKRAKTIMKQMSKLLDAYNAKKNGPVYFAGIRDDIPECLLKHIGDNIQVGPPGKYKTVAQIRADKTCHSPGSDAAEVAALVETQMAELLANPNPTPPPKITGVKRASDTSNSDDDDIKESPKKKLRIDDTKTVTFSRDQLQSLCEFVVKFAGTKEGSTMVSSLFETAGAGASDNGLTERLLRTAATDAGATAAKTLLTSALKKTSEAKPTPAASTLIPAPVKTVKFTHPPSDSD